MMYHRISVYIELINFSNSYILSGLWAGSAAVMDPRITPPNILVATLQPL